MNLITTLRDKKKIQASLLLIISLCSCGKTIKEVDENSITGLPISDIHVITEVEPQSSSEVSEFPPLEVITSQRSITIQALPSTVLKGILSYTDTSSCIATYNLSKSYLEVLELCNEQLSRDQVLVPKVLGHNFVATKAWRALDVNVLQLTVPELSTQLITEIKRLHQVKQKPLLFLDLGKSIKELEELCKVKAIKILKADGDDQKLRAELIYQEQGLNIRWLVLPGLEYGILPGSRSKTYQIQIQTMEHNYPGYEIGSARELVQLTILKYLQDGTVLFPSEPSTYGRCKEVYQLGNGKEIQITLGNASSSSANFEGLTVHNPSFVSVIAHPIRGLIAFAAYY
jgi:hypothetical protein